MNRKTIVTFLAAAGLALGAGIASAQGWGGGGGCGGYGYYGGGYGHYGSGHHYGGGGGWVWSEEAFKERMAARHERLKEVLKITSKQEAAWKTFNDRMLALKRAAPPDPAEFAGLTAPERMEKRLELSRQFQGTMDERIAIVKEFYAGLTAEQKKAFDDWHSPGRWGDDKRGWKQKRR
jgi:hypothetical protein